MTEIVRFVTEKADITPARPSLPPMVLAWLASFTSPNTVGAYTRDATAFLAWCAPLGLEIADLRRVHIDTWARVVLEQERRYAPATVARKIATISSMLDYLLDEEVVERNAAKKTRRPKLSADHTDTPALDDAQSLALVQAASRPGERLRTRVAVGILLTLGLRVSELVTADIEDLGIERGTRTLSVTRKGGARQRLPLPASVAADIDLVVGSRTCGPLLVTSSGRRVDRHALYRTVKRLAVAAGIPPAHIGPHALRRTLVTSMLAGGEPLRDVQVLVGHVDPRTTARYDRGHQRLARQAAAVTRQAATCYPD